MSLVKVGVTRLDAQLLHNDAFLQKYILEQIKKGQNFQKQIKVNHFMSYLKDCQKKLIE